MCFYVCDRFLVARVSAHALLNLGPIVEGGVVRFEEPHGHDENPACGTAVVVKPAR